MTANAASLFDHFLLYGTFMAIWLAEQGVGLTQHRGSDVILKIC